MSQHVEASLERHKEAFGHAPELYGADRGFFSEKNVRRCEQVGVTVVCIPQRGGEREASEKSAAVKEGQRFRAGIEGRISVLFRGRGMKRCLAEGRERFELLIGAAVRFRRALGAYDCREAHENWCLVARNCEQRSFGVSREIRASAERAVCAGPAGMDDALWNTLAVESRELFDQVKVLQEHAALGAGGLRMLVVGDRRATVLGQRRQVRGDSGRG